MKRPSILRRFLMKMFGFTPLPEVEDYIKCGCTPPREDLDNPYKCKYSPHWVAASWRSDLCPAHRSLLEGERK